MKTLLDNDVLKVECQQQNFTRCQFQTLKVPHLPEIPKFIREDLPRSLLEVFSSNGSTPSCTLISGCSVFKGVCFQSLKGYVFTDSTVKPFCQPASILLCSCESVCASIITYQIVLHQGILDFVIHLCQLVLCLFNCKHKQQKHDDLQWA